MDYDLETGRYTVIDSTKDAAKETTWRLICRLLGRFASMKWTRGGSQ